MNVSCLIATKNPNYKDFKKALKSAKSQVDQIVIVDDFSDNNTINKIIKEVFNDRYDITVFRNKSKIGLTKSLIKGINYCKHDLIARLDDDDYWMPGKIEQQKKAFEKDANVVLCFTSYRVFYKDKIKEKLLKYVNFKKELIIQNPFVHSSSLIKKSAYYLSSGYDQRFLTCQDYDLWTRLSMVGKITCIDNVLTCIKFHERFKLKDINKLNLQFFTSLVIKIKFSSTCGKLIIFLPLGILYSFKILFLNYLLVIKELLGKVIKKA